MHVKIIELVGIYKLFRYIGFFLWEIPTSCARYAKVDSMKQRESSSSASRSDNNIERPEYAILLSSSHALE